MNQTIPIGAWIRMNVQGIAFVGFTYVDPQAGLSARGGRAADANVAETPNMTVRLPMPGCRVEPLSDVEITQLGLPAAPSWLGFFGPQPELGADWGTWREHPKLRGKFHPECPDDVQVIVHDGGPRMTDHSPELVWVTVTAHEGDVFTGRVLNQPHQLTSVSQGSEIQFIVPDHSDHPLLVTEKYLQERPDWIIHACNKCELSELFDPPSELIKVVFPNAPDGSKMGMFSSFCGACGGVQLVQHQSQADMESPDVPESPSEVDTGVSEECPWCNQQVVPTNDDRCPACDRPI